MVWAALSPMALPLMQASLPVSNGGLAIKKVAWLSPAAFLSSTVQTKPIVDRILSNLQHQRSTEDLLLDFLTFAGPFPHVTVEYLLDTDQDRETL